MTTTVSENHSRERGHSSESTEHYTPADIVGLARSVMGGIDLDPASCAEANAVIAAAEYFTTADDEFTKPWHGKVFLNPPGGLSDNLQRRVVPKCRQTGACGLPLGHTHDGVVSSQKKWWFRLAREYAQQRVSDAVFVCFSVELLQTTQVDPPEGLRLPLDCAICYPSSRLKYWKPGGKVGTSPPHASAVVYLGLRSEVFAETFGRVGRVVVPMDSRHG